MRTFSTGATRDNDENKIDPEGFLSPLVIQEYCEYMRRHQVQADGERRASDNWQKGIPDTAYMKSLWRHYLDAWIWHRGQWMGGDLIDVYCAIIFNAMGLLYNELTRRDEEDEEQPTESPDADCGPELKTE